MQLFNQYRPHTIDDLAGHKRAKSILSRVPLSGRSWWITGKSGIGKTTIGGIIAGKVADPLNVLELDAGDLTPAKLEDIERGSRSYAIGDKPGRAVIVNESHGLRRDSVRKLLVVLERIPDHVVWIFTTTIDGMKSFDGIDSAPLLSRCLLLNLEPDREAFAYRAMEIADDAGLGGAPFAEYVRLLEFCDDNLRTALCQIEAGVMLEGAS